MNILFVYSLDYGLLPNGLIQPPHIQFGISYISSFLQKYGHRTELVILSRLFGPRRNRAILRECLHEFQPKLLCFTAVATQYDFIREIAEYVKCSYPEIYLLVGGVHVTLNSEEALADNFDAVCIGEGEDPTLELVSQLEDGGIPANIPNLWIKYRSKIQQNSPREFLPELDNLPFPDIEMWLRREDKKPPDTWPVLVSRGCPFNCSYCCNHALRNIASGRYVRYRSPKNISEEIKRTLIELPTIKEIYLETETISANRDWCMELCSELEYLNTTLDHPLSFGANLRITPNVNLENIFSALRRGNFKFLKIGLESGSERIRREILRREYSNDDIINTVELARKYGLQIHFYNLMGLPQESFDDFKETVKVNQICKPDWYHTSIFFPYPGTDLYFLCKKQGLLKRPLDPRNERCRAVLDLPQFPKKKIQECFNFFKYYIYFGINPEDRLKLVIISLLDRCLSHIPFLKYLKHRIKIFLQKQINK